MKLKRILAVAMATTMVLGMSMTAFAADGAESGNDAVDGTGTSEGHVEKKHFNVVLPTATATTFAYTMDPERLIQTTKGGKYADGTKFPDADGDTGVYFLTDTNTYANTSNDLQIINKSSDPVKVDIKVKATASAGGKDITLADAAIGASETASKLYLAAVVGEGDGATTQIISGTEATVKKKLDGNANNYEVVVVENEGVKSYAYKQKTTGLTDWKALKFNVTGAVSNVAIASDTTAPKITVTWSFDKYADTDAEAYTAAGVGTYSETPAKSSAGQITVASSKATVAITVGEDGAVPISMTNDWFTGNMFELTNTWGASYNAETKVITFDTGIGEAIVDSENENHAAAVGAKYTVTFKPTTGENYTQELTFAE